MGTKKKKSQKQYPLDEKGMISLVFDETVRQIRKTVNDRDYFEHIYDLYGATLKRRESATLSVLKQVKERYGDKYQGLDLAQNMAFMCGSISFSAELTEYHNHIALAAAMFMLDEIKDMGRLANAFEYFSTDESAVEFAELPEDFFDPCHENEVLKGMICLIDNRMRGTDWRKKYYNEVSAKDESPAPPEIKEPSDELTFKERFDAVFDLVPQVYKDRAMKRFEDKLWEYIDLYLEHAYSLFKQEEDLTRKSEAIYSQCDALKKEMEDRERTVFTAPLAPSVLVNPKAPLPILTQDHIEKGFSDRDRIMTLAAQGVALQDKIDDISLERTRLSLVAAAAFSPSDFGSSDNDRVKASAFYDQVLKLSVEDPYEICFGFLCHLVAGSDLVWLYNPALAVLGCAASHLPWTVYIPGDEEDDNEEDSGDASEEKDGDDGLTDGPEDTEDGPSEFNPIDWNVKKAELYSKKYNDAALYFPFEPPEELNRINLPQLVYSYTHAVMPRDVRTFDGEHEELMKSGLDKASAIMMELYLQLSDSAQYASKNWRYFLGTRSFKDLSEGIFEPEEDEEIEITDIADKDEEIAKLRKATDELKQALYAVSKELKTVKAKHEAETKEHERERMELADLREIVFMAKNGEEPDEPKSQAVFLPYTAKKRTVVFGGHESWVSSIRPMLPEVTFVDKRMSPNENLIRHADVVWVQSNALAHKHFYKLIDVARTWAIPVRYFAFASPEKCARQLAEYDLEISR